MVKGGILFILLSGCGIDVVNHPVDAGIDIEFPNGTCLYRSTSSMLKRLYDVKCSTKELHIYPPEPIYAVDKLTRIYMCSKKEETVNRVSKFTRTTCVEKEDITKDIFFRSSNCTMEYIGNNVPSYKCWWKYEESYPKVLPPMEDR